jgi:aminoethylphosphonate catabolism LysR family transcriptional regulator
MFQKWLQAFHKVATEGGFTAAARALNVGQPTVSTHVKSLEDHFGVELFFRHGRSVELTPVGRSLLTITQGLYGHEDEAVNFLKTARDLRAGQLNVSSLGPYDVMELLAAFHGRYPEVRLSVSLATTDEVLANLLRFDADIGILGHDPADPRVFCTFYNRHRILVLVNVDHPLARQRQVRLAELEGESMVLRTQVSTTRQAFDQALARVGVRVRPIMEINSREAVREAIIRGLGVGVVAAPEYAPHESLRTLIVTDADMYVYAYVVCLAERRERPLVRAVFDVAGELAGRHVSGREPVPHT